jgi:D-beta-D-heptose 7-phosphate kinase/D-beta-D-heptose 1-phosphate adenosyltransferase
MIVPDFSKTRILVFGDVMLDEYVHGRVDRISPEAPVPVFIEERCEYRPGGAANVAENVRALGAMVTLCGGAKTSTKMRYMAGAHQLLRVDKDAIGSDAGALAELRSVEGEFDAIIVSDYAKGAVTERAFLAILEMASPDIPVFVDPKRKDFSFYEGATWLCPNAKERAEATSPARRASMLVTKGAEGMAMSSAVGLTLRLSATASHAVDVTGAGDTVIAVFASAIAAGSSPYEAMQLANAAAGVVVGKRGTAVCTIDELREAACSS